MSPNRQLSETDNKLLAEGERLARAADRFEAYARPHAERIARYADALAATVGLSRRDRYFLRLAALLHDLGEMKMNRDYIQSDAPLTFEEKLDLHRHPVIGEQETARIGAPRAVQLLVRWHHEWWNGEGYPDGLRRANIPLAARILQVTDVYCALTEHRPFRPAWTSADARRHLTEWAGLQFDPAIIQAFLALPSSDETEAQPDTQITAIAPLIDEPDAEPPTVMPTQEVAFENEDSSASQTDPEQSAQAPDAARAANSVE